MRKIYVVGGDNGYANWMQGRLTDKLEMSDLVVMTGGEDVNPNLYNEKPHYTTQYNNRRDSYEVPIFKQAVKLRKKIIGICRGAQLACAMAGGKLVQHQDNPRFIHGMETYDGKNILTSSCHHQAQYPWALNKSLYKVLGWSRGESDFHLDSEENELVNGVVSNDKEVELAYYPEIQALTIQGHPEMVYKSRNQYKSIDEYIKYVQNLLDKLMEDKL